MFFILINASALKGQVLNKNTEDNLNPLVMNFDAEDTSVMDAPAKSSQQIREPDQETLQIYPTPVRSDATLTFWVRKNSYVTIDLLDITGMKVRNLISAYYNQGWKTESISTNDLMSGRYIMVFQTNDEKKVLPFVILR